jgi:CRP-like cAMP-binding protein
VSAGKSHVLKFPIRVWQEVCQSDMIYLSTRTFERQMQELGIFPTQLLLGVAGVGIEVKHCSNEGPKQARVILPKMEKEARVTLPKMQTDMRSVSALQQYFAANTAFFLGNFELLSHLTPHSLLKLALKSKLRAFEPHTVILTQGLPWPSVDGNQVAYLILSGQLRKHKKASGGEVDTDKWHALHQLLQARALFNPSSNDKSNLVAPESSVAIPPKFEDVRGKDVWAVVAECFGPLEQCMLHGTVVGENHLLFGRDAKSLATYITGTQVLALELKVQDLVEIDGEARGVVAHPNLAASVLQLKPSSRDKRDLDILSGCIHRVPLFATLPAQALSELCHKATLRSLMPGQILFEHGDEADEIFIVLSGTLGVHAMPSKVSETEEQKREKEAEEAVAPALHVAFSTCEATTSKAAPDGKSRGDAAIVGPCTGLRTEGQSIGQAILYSSSIKATRKTSVKARGKAAVMVIKLADLIAYQSFVNRRAFFEPAKMIQVLFEPSLRSDDDLLAIGEFVRSLPLFSAFEAAELSVLAKYVKAEKKSAGTVLYRRQEHLSALYFLVQGTAAICRPDPLQDMDAIHKSNAQRFEAGHVIVKDADVQQVSKYGVIQHFARDGDTLVEEVTGRGPDALARLAKDTTLFSHSCILVKPSIVASLNFKSIAECIAEWKQMEAEEALMVLSRSYPFSSWKQKEVAVLAGLAQRLVYQRGSHIFEQASAADRIFLVQKGEVSLVQKGMSHLVPSAPLDAGKEPIRLQHSEKGTISAESRRADIAVTTVSNGGVLGVDLVKQLNTEKGKTVAIKLAETEGKLLQAQKDLKKSLNDNMSRSVLQSIQAQINALTRQRNDLLSQHHKIKTEGVLRHQYRAVVASSVAKLIAVRRVDIDSIGPRGSTTQIDKHHRNVVHHRAGFRSDIGSKHEMRLLQGFGGRRDDAALGDEVESEQSAIQERRRLVGDVRVVAALSGQRGGYLLKEDKSVSPQAAVASLMNLRKWLRKKYGKLGSAATILSCFHGGEVISDSALKALCDESACGLKPAQLRTAIARPSSLYARLDSKDKVNYLPAPRSGGIDRGGQMPNDGMDDNTEERNEVIFFSDLKKTLDNEEMLIDAAMRVARRSGIPAENAVAEHPSAYGAPPDVLLESAIPEEDTSCVHVTSDSLETSLLSQKRAEQDTRAAGCEERAGEEQREPLFERGRPQRAMTARDRSQNLCRDEQRPNSAAESRVVRPNKFALIPGESEDDPYILQEMPGDLSQESALEITENALRSQSPRRRTAIAARVDSERPVSAMSFRSDWHSRHGGRKGPMHGMSGRFPRPKTAFTRRSEWAAGIDRELDAFDGDFQVFLLSFLLACWSKWRWRGAGLFWCWMTAKN